ncbi:sorting nexin-24 isoform X1 [Caretta caretta]|uniref:sorting nexin-24 isoform X1 n=2 Tax=Caretta caretta TaxID=8467 RepID=UPI00209527F7|nr:sorting nexin-24 isoform X2 [Caretta caretta]
MNPFYQNSVPKDEMPKYLKRISKDMKDRGCNRDPQQCRLKLKELRQAYQKTQEANARSGSEPQTCRFCDELPAILQLPHTCTWTSAREFHATGMKILGMRKMIAHTRQAEKPFSLTAGNCLSPWIQYPPKPGSWTLKVEKAPLVFKIEVLMSGRKHFVEKRYSEFHALHKKLKRFIRTPEIPSKHVRNWVPKVLEQRRQGLEIYLQTIILENEDLPKIFLDFLNVRHVPSLPKAESYGSFDETESEESSKLSHQPVLLFLRDPYVLPTANDDFPNVVIEGVLHGIFYPHLLPR